MAGFEPANDGVKVRYLTAWLHPYKGGYSRRHVCFLSDTPTSARGYHTTPNLAPQVVGS